MSRFLLLRHPSGWLALDEGLVERVLARPLLSGLPGSPDYVIGAFRLGEAVVPVVDLDRRWHAAPPPGSVRDRLVLAKSGVALRAGEPRSLVETDVRPLAEDVVVLPQARPFVRGAVAFAEGVAAVLDLERLLELPPGAAAGEPLEEGWSPEELALLQERAQAYAAEERAASVPPDSRSIAVLRLGEGRFAVDAAQVREFVHLARVVRVPGAPATVQGMTLLRGRILPVLDGRRLLGFPGTSPTDLAVVLAEPEAVVLVDEVEEVRSVELARIGDRRVDLPEGPVGRLDLALLVGGEPVDGGCA